MCPIVNSVYFHDCFDLFAKNYDLKLICELYMGCVKVQDLFQTYLLNRNRVNLLRTPKHESIS